MNKIHIRGIPIPPTSNKMYWARTFKTKTGKIAAKFSSSNEKINYEKEFLHWALKNKALLLTVKPELEKWISKKNGMIYLDFYFALPREELLTLKNKPKKIDASNRLKVINDELSKAIGIDDKYFHGSYRFVISESNTRYCGIYLSETKLYTAKEYLDLCEQ